MDKVKKVVEFYVNNVHDKDDKEQSDLFFDMMDELTFEEADEFFWEMEMRDIDYWGTKDWVEEEEEEESNEEYSEEDEGKYVGLLLRRNRDELYDKLVELEVIDKDKVKVKDFNFKNGCIEFEDFILLDGLEVSFDKKLVDFEDSVYGSKLIEFEIKGKRVFGISYEPDDRKRWEMMSQDPDCIITIDGEEEK